MSKDYPSPGVSYNLSDFSTKELVDELESRTGVEVSTLAPNVNASVGVSGPAIVLVVID